MINFDIPDNRRIKKILESCEKEYGEIGDYNFEDNYISFTVYLGHFEKPIKEIIIDRDTKLIFMDKFDDPFYSLNYKIINIQNIDCSL